MTIEWRSEWTGRSVVGSVCFGLGVTVGYIVCSRRKDSIIHYVKTEHEVVVEPESTTETESGTEITEDLGYITLSTDVPDEVVLVEEVTVSVFPDDDPNWDYDEEKKKRGSDHPYVIHRDEYYAQEKDYGQSTLTYYAGDEILVDEADVPIHRHERITGPLEFGKGSNDPNVVHIRNDHLDAEYEIIRDSGHYAVEVLGHDIEDFHARQDEKPIIHKFRQD